MVKHKKKLYWPSILTFNQRKNLLRKSNTLKEFIRELGKQYQQRNITSWLIIDQINGITSFMREWNDFIFQNGDLLEKMTSLCSEEQILLNKQLQNQQIMHQHPAKQLKDLFQTVRLLGKGFVLNSPISIETSLIQDPDKHKNQFPASHTQDRTYQTLMLPLLEKHEAVVRIKANYHKNLRENFAKPDFWHFFWFELERNLLEREVSKEKLSVAKRIFLLAASKAQVKGFFRHIYVFDCLIKTPLAPKLSQKIKELPTHQAIVRTLGSGLQEYISLEDLKKMFPFKQILDKTDKTQKQQGNLQKTEAKSAKQSILHPIEAYFSEYLRIFQRFACGQERLRLTRFIAKGNKQQKKKFLLILISLAQRRLETNSPFSYSIGVIDAIMEKGCSETFLSQENNQDLLPVKIEYCMIHFEWSPSEFIELAVKIVSSNAYRYYASLLSDFRRCNTEHSVYWGSLFGQLLLLQLQPSTTISFPIYQNLGSTYTFNDLNFEITQILAFQPFHNKIHEKAGKTEMSQLASTSQGVNAFKGDQDESIEMRLEQQAQQEIQPINVEEHFKEIIRQCQQKEGKIVAAIPKHDERLQCSRQPIDFLFASKANGKYEFFAFAVTVGSSRVDTKMAAARRYLKRLCSSNQNSFIFNHYILCPQKKCKKAELISDSVSIRFACIDDFKIHNSKNEPEQVILEELQRINRRIRQLQSWMFV